LIAEFKSRAVFKEDVGQCSASDIPTGFDPKYPFHGTALNLLNTIISVIDPVDMSLIEGDNCKGSISRDNVIVFISKVSHR